VMVVRKYLHKRFSAVPVRKVTAVNSLKYTKH